MKTITFFALMIAAFLAVDAQTTVNPFSKIQAEGNIEVTLVNSDAYSVTFTGSEAAPEGLQWESGNGTLTLTANKVKETVQVRVAAPNVSEIGLTSVASLNTDGTYKTNVLTLMSEGAAEYNMALDCQDLNLNFKGASEATLSGNTNNLTAKLSGASEVKAYELQTKTANITTDGASDIRLNVSESLKATGSGASEIKYKGEPAQVEVDIDGVASVKKSDGTEIEVPSEISEIEDIDIDVECDEDDISFDGHWAGVDLMMNNFVSKYGELNTAPGYDFMELDFAKSLGVQINFMEFNYNIIKEKFGVTTGLGLSIMNYRLADNVRLTGDSAVLMASVDNISATIRSKLTTTYLTLPLLFEFQTNPDRNSRSVHFGIGAFGGVRIGSHYKVVVDDRGDKDKFKSDGNFHLNPFRYGAMIRFGWNSINLFANYSFSEMFQKNEGPAVYPVEFGISLGLN